MPTDLRALAESIAATIPPGVAHVPNADLWAVTRNELDRWLAWHKSAVGQLVDAASGDEDALRSKVCPYPDVGGRPEADQLLLSAAIHIWVEHRRSTEPAQEQATRLARMSLGGVPAESGTFRSEAVALARKPFTLRVAARQLASDIDDWPINSFERAREMIDDYEQRTREGRDWQPPGLRTVENAELSK